METRCPKCKSVRVQPAPMIYMSGTKKSMAVSVGTRSARISGGVLQSGITALAEPPQRPMAKVHNWIMFFKGKFIKDNVKMGLAICVLYFGYKVMARAADSIEHIHLINLFWAFVVGYSIRPLVTIAKLQQEEQKYADEEYQKEIEEYEKTWICKKCGHSFFVED